MHSKKYVAFSNIPNDTLTITVLVSHLCCSNLWWCAATKKVEVLCLEIKCLLRTTHSLCKRTFLLPEEVKTLSGLAVGIILRKSVILKEHHGGPVFSEEGFGEDSIAVFVSWAWGEELCIKCHTADGKRHGEDMWWVQRDAWEEVLGLMEWADTEAYCESIRVWEACVAQGAEGTVSGPGEGLTWEMSLHFHFEWLWRRAEEWKGDRRTARSNWYGCLCICCINAVPLNPSSPGPRL